jgi:hypothetical protein
VIQIENGREGLILGTGGDAPLAGQMIEKGFDLARPHVPWMSFVVEKNEANDPLHVRFFRANRGVLQSQLRSHLIEQSGRLG